MSRRTPYEFGDHRLDPLTRVLSQGGRPIPLAPKAFDLLMLLVEGRGRVLERDELIRELWPDTVVEEANLTFQVSTLRKALGEDGPRWIETVPKHGYRFTARVREAPPEPSPITAGEAAPAVPPPPAAVSTTLLARRPRLIVAAGVALALVLGARGWLWREAASEAPRAPASVAVPLTTYQGWEGQPTLSPDGSQMVYAADGAGHDNLDLYLKMIGPGEPHRLTTDPASDISPAWSPDGRRIAFLRRLPAEGQYAIHLIPALGGDERRLGEIDLTPFRSAPGTLLAWTPDGRWLAAAGRFTPDAPSEIWLIAPDSGERRRLTSAGGGQIGDFGLAFSPDGRFLAFLRFATRSVGDVYLLPLEGGVTARGNVVRLTHEHRLVGGPAWNARGNRIFYSSGGALGYRTLRTLAIDPDRPGQRVEPVPLAAGEHATTLAVARDRLVYAREQRDTNLWRLPLSARGASAGAPTPLIGSTFDEYNPDVSADGTRVTFTSTRSGTEEIWVANIDGSAATQMTSVGGPNTSNPRWSPDGREILLNSRRSGSSDLYLVDVATRAWRRLTEDATDEYEPRWSRDGRSIYFVSTRTGRPEVWKMPSGGGPSVQVTRLGGGAAVESPDRRWLYYAKDASPMSIWKVPVEGGEHTKVLDGLSYSFNFAVTASGIYLLAARGPAPSIEFFDLATRRTSRLHTLDRPFWFGFALSPDERSILFSKIDSRASDLMLVENLR
jgi:Tol biopolymer transport system component/DNA-binding winged helix-turn-helix (wHTH) protein